MLSHENRPFLIPQLYLFGSHLFHLRDFHPRLYLRRTPIGSVESPSWGMAVERSAYPKGLSGFVA